MDCYRGAFFDECRNQPGDHTEKINLEKVVNITKASFLNMWKMANEKEL